MAESPGLGVVRCLEQLSDAEFLKFKELLRKNPKLQDKLISWTNTETTLRKDLITLLNAHFPGQVWDIMSSMFLQVNRRDLWTKAQELRRDKRSTYKEIMKTTFHHIWFWETFIRIPVKSYQEIVKIQHKALQTVFGPQLRPVTAVILGAEAIGKTTFLRKAMLDWASGDLWQNRFQYVFFFSLISLNSTTELSLAQLLLSQLSASSETLDDVLSDPRKILFILDGFDHLKFDLELRTNLCDDWRKTLPTQIVLSSLLQKVMLPESSLLLELGNPSIPKLYPLLQYPREITMGGLTEESIKFYCVCFFNHVEKGLEVFDYLQSMQALPDLCISPYVCWMFCSTVKGQCDRGEEMNFFCPSDSIMYTKFMVSSFRSVYDKHPSRQNRARLKTLCTLAAEGMWKQVFVFKSEDLRRNGISESEQTSWLRMNFLHYQGDCFMFYHPMLQSYFAALFYYLRQDKDTPQPIIGSLPQFLREVYAHGQTQWLRTGMFVFGIASEEVVAMLNPHFGLIPRREIREVIFNCLRSLSKGEHNKTLSDQSLIDSLIDIQKEKFETQVMDLFEELTVDISDANKMTLVEYSLLKSLKLKKLHMHIHHSIFSEIYNPEDGDIEDFRRHRKIANKYWGSLCGIFWNLQVLDLDSCNFNETAIQHLCESLSPAPHISLNMFKLQSLSLGKCGISSKACGEIAASLIYCKLKHLSLVENPLKNKGAMLLCEILRHPSCILEKLM
ncbi:NACHT, LRR and PYD domains-containing protein 9B [Lemmus lemmus]